MLYSYYVGLDLVRKADYTAVAIVEEPAWVPPEAREPEGWAWRLGIEGKGWVSPASIRPDALRHVLAANRREGKPPDAPLSLRHPQRYPLGTPYPEIVAGVKAMLATPPLAGRPTTLVADAIGVGAGVVDMFVHAGLSPVAVTITGGDKVNRSPLDASSLRVPKRDLIGAAQVLLQSGRLKIAKALPEAETLRRELQDFRVKIDPKTAHDSYSHWREGVHDDLVLATALAAWFRGWWNAHLDTKNALASLLERR